MAVAALPGLARPRYRKLRSHARAAATWLLSPAKPVLANLASIPFTVAGWALLSACAFRFNTTIGLGASGVILMLLERQIADEQ
jgi:hypothetical protein